MGNKSVYERQASSVLGQVDGIGRKAHRFWLAACWGYCLVISMSGDSQNNALASTSPSPHQHPMAILARRFFPPESRERRMARRAAAEQERIHETDLSNPHIHVWVITTASLPWMTGTSINPLLRAAFLVRGRDANMVTLMIPFLAPEDQPKVFPPNLVFNTAEEQEAWVRNWLEEAGLGREAARLRMMFYPGRYHKDYGSIFPMGDLTLKIPSEEADVCILEEPEHLNWYRAPGRSWRRAFKHVVGIVHTNYLAYASTYTVWGPLLTFMLRYMNIIMARAYCHKIIKLSSVIQSLAPEKETVCNVHGVREKFLEVGDEYAHKSHNGGAYFIGKSLWAKGYDRLINLLEYSHDRLGRSFHLDVYGSGPDREEIEQRATDKGCDLTFFPATDHALLGKYSVFVNPSVTEVLCTTVAEALAMGKWVVCSRHPSNEFFFQFPNCLPFTTEEDFAACVSWALRHDPEELTQELRYKLTWTAATERLLEAAAMTVGERNRQKPVADGILAIAHAVVGSGPSGDFVRLLAGGDSAAWQNRYVHEQRMQEKEMERARKRAALGDVEEGTAGTTGTATTSTTSTTRSTPSNTSPSGTGGSAIGAAAAAAAVATSL